MAVTLTKAQKARRQALLTQVNDSREFIAEEWGQTRADLRDAIKAYNANIATHNQARARLREFAGAVAEEWRDLYEGRSEAWRDGEAGQSTLEFIEAWEEAAGLQDIEPIQLLEPDAPDVGKPIELPEEA